MKIGALNVFLYLLAITISIILGSYGEIILGVFWVISTGILFLIGFFLTKLMIIDKPKLHPIEDINRIEHIIIPLFFLLGTLIDRIISFVWPTMSDILLLMEPAYTVIVVPICSFSFGTAIAYSRFDAATNESLVDE